jgi:hypothetical protein
MRAWRVRWRPDCCWSNSWVGSFGGCGLPLACRTGALLPLYAAGKRVVKLAYHESPVFGSMILWYPACCGAPV